MDGWKIRRAVDLQEDSPPVERLRALATLSSRQAHDFVIVVLDGDKPADLTGMQLCFFNQFFCGLFGLSADILKHGSVLLSYGPQDACGRAA